MRTDIIIVTTLKFSNEENIQRFSVVTDSKKILSTTFRKLSYENDVFEMADQI